MKTIMTEADICKDFNEAKDRRLQIGILADLNACNQEQIIRILILNGQDVTPAAPKKLGKGQDKVLLMMYRFLDEMEAEVLAAEQRYLNIVESLRQYGRK